MKIRTVEYFIKEAFLSLRRNQWMTVASIATVFVSLFVFGIFLSLIGNADKMASMIESKVQISVYLKDSLNNSEIENLQAEIREMQGIKSVNYVPKEEALEQFKERLGEQEFLLEAIGDTNPLPNSFNVEVKQPEMIKTAAEVIEGLNGVIEAKYGQDVVEHFFAITRFIRLCSFAIVIVLAFATTFVISNTIRLTVFARRKEIAIMKYVGATDSFIRWPFLVEGVALGFIGSFIAAIFVYFSYKMLLAKIYSSFAFISLLPAMPFIFYIGIIMVLCGSVIGAIGSTYSLKKFLKV